MSSPSAEKRRDAKRRIAGLLLSLSDSDRKVVLEDLLTDEIDEGSIAGVSASLVPQRSFLVPAALLPRERSRRVSALLRSRGGGAPLEEARSFVVEARRQRVDSSEISRWVRDNWPHLSLVDVMRSVGQER
jgi:hypothetical protein